MKAKYINPFTDFGFKKLFGEEASKPMLIDFLNSLLPESNIIDLAFKDKEQLGQTDQDRKVIYDIYCENDKGEKFIVELQKAKQKYFKDRTIYYSTFPIREQAEKGEWNYQLKAVYCIGILDFTFDDYDNEPEKSEVIHTVQLKDQHNRLFFDKLKYVYLEMPNFKKAEQELENRLDEWLYFIRNLEDFQTIPTIFEDEIFRQAFEKAEIAKYSEREYNEYQQSLKYFRDNNNTFDYAVETAFDEGKDVGKMESAIKIAKALKENGVPKDIISKSTGLSETDIENL
jgi:predicted transposase/invertase (TIGR01784 family)